MSRQSIRRPKHSIQFLSYEHMLDERKKRLRVRMCEELERRRRQDPDMIQNTYFSDESSVSNMI